MAKPKTPDGDAWVAAVEESMAEFAKKHANAYAKKKREQSAIFEIGCFLALVDDYVKHNFSIVLENLDKDGSFKYLTSPNGNPDNFSHITLEKNGYKFSLRQQIRIRSHLHPDVTFTPDIVVFEHGAPIEQKIDPDYAGGKRGMFALASAKVIAVYECKSLPGYPELYVSFLGMMLTVHSTFDAGVGGGAGADTGSGHLASTLFVGGESSALHVRMIAALQSLYPLNIITGLHKGAWILTKRKKPLNRIAVGQILANKALNPTAAKAAAG